MDPFVACKTKASLPQAGAVDGAGSFRHELHIAKEDPVFPGHFPHLPIYPGVLVLDLMQQSVRRHAELNFGLKATLSDIVRVSFQNPVFPGDTLIVSGECDVQSPSLMRARVSVESAKVIAKARLDFKVSGHAG